VVDADLNPPGHHLTVVANTARLPGAPPGGHPPGSTVPVQRSASGTAFVSLREVPPSEVLVLVNRG
jgi:hypothetical protein